MHINLIKNQDVRGKSRGAPSPELYSARRWLCRSSPLFLWSLKYIYYSVIPWSLHYIDTSRSGLTLYMLLSINSNVLWILLIILSLTCGMFGSFNLNCKSRNEKKKKKHSDFHLPSRGWLGEGEMKRRRLMGKRYTLGGRKCPRGPLLIFTPKTYVIYICILLLYNIKTVK